LWRTLSNSRYKRPKYFVKAKLLSGTDIDTGNTAHVSAIFASRLRLDDVKNIAAEKFV